MKRGLAKQVAKMGFMSKKDPGVMDYTGVENLRSEQVAECLAAQ